MALSEDPSVCVLSTSYSSSQSMTIPCYLQFYEQVTYFQDFHHDNYPVHLEIS